MRCRNCGWDNPSEKQRCEKCNAPLAGSMIASSEPERPQPSPERNYRQPESENLRSTVKETGNEQAYIPSPAGFAIPREQVANESAGPAAPGQCTGCGYPVSIWMKVCPNCGQTIGASAPAPQVPQPQITTCPACSNPIPVGTKFCPNCGKLVAGLRPQQPAGPAVGPATPGRPSPYRQGPHAGTVNPWMKPQEAHGFCSLQPKPWDGEGVTYNPITYSGDEIILNRANTDPNNQSITSKEQAVLTHDDQGWYIEDRSAQQTTFVRAGRRIPLQSGDIIVLGNRLFEFKG